MSRIERVFSFYVFSNLHVALSTSCLVILTLKPYRLSDWRTVLFVFCGTVLAYNFIRVVQVKKLYPLMSNWMHTSRKELLVLNGIVLIGLVYATFQFSWLDLAFVFPFFLLTLFYVLPYRGKLRGLRKLPGFKLFLIASVWAGVTVLFPIWTNNLQFDVKVWVVFAQRILFILAITIPFDIRDLQLDDSDLATLPQTLGVKRSKLLALGALLLFTIGFFYDDLFADWERWSGIVTGFVAAFFVLKTGISQNRYYSAFWVEGIPVLWLFLALVIR